MQKMWLTLGLSWLLSLGARAQDTDPAVWGVYARLPGAKMALDDMPKHPPYSWYWNDDKSAIVEDEGEGWDKNEIRPLGSGKLRYVRRKGVADLIGTVQPDGAVIWRVDSTFINWIAGDFRVRLDGDALLMESVELKNGEVIKAKPRMRWTGLLPAAAARADNAASAPVAAASAPEVAAATATALADTQPGVEKTGPRELSEADLAKLRNSIVRDKQQRAETLKRQAEDARRQEVARRQQAEFDAQMAAQRAEQERQARAEERASEDAFAGALMGGLNAFRGAMAQNQAQQAQQQAFVANLQRQQQANEARQREAERQRQTAAQEQQAARQRAAAAAAAQPPAQQTVLAGNSGGNGAGGGTAARPTPLTPAQIAEQQLRENAAADRLRRQQLQSYQAAQARATQPAQTVATVASSTAPKTLPATPPAAQQRGLSPASSCRVERNTTMAVGRNKTEETTRADVEAMAARQCQGKGQLGPIQCSSYKDISIDSHGKQHDLGTRTYDCTAVVDCGTTREICYGAPQSGSAQ